MLKLNIVNLSASVDIRNIEIHPDEIELDAPEYVSPIKAKFSLNKVGTEIYVRADLDADCECLCDRCLEPFTAKITEMVRMIYTCSSDLIIKNEDYVFSINEGANEIDVTKPIKETLILGIPIKKVCTQDCKGLCSHCGENLNITTCNCVQVEIDPRWEALSKLVSK